MRSGSANLNSAISGNSGHYAGPKAVWRKGVLDGQEISQFARKLIETVYGDAKQHGILRQVKLRGRAKVELLFTLAAKVVNLRRLPKLLAPEPSG